MKKTADEILNSIIKHFKSQPKKALTAKDFDMFPSSYLMDNWDNVKKVLEAQGFQIKASTRIAMEITEKPIIESDDKIPLVLRSSDFKDTNMFHSIMEQLGLHSKFKKQLEQNSDLSADDYDEIELIVIKSRMRY